MSGPPNSASEGPAPLKGGALAVTSIALALGTFMQVLDSSIANVSIPTIAGNLGVSSDQGTWVITSFAVANGISVPVSGFLMMRFGVVRTFVVSVVLFTLASLLCGLSWSLGSLVAFRVIQGAVSGPMIPGSQALLIAIFPPSRRGAALAIWSMTTLIAPICGPIFGGYISDNFPWPWIFLINLPVGIVCGAICWRMLSNRETPTRRLPIDRIGFALLVVWVGALQIMLDKGKDADWFASPAILVLAVVAVVGFIAWVIWEVTDANPIVDLSLFASRNFAIGTLVFCLGYGLLFGNLVLLPLWLQTQLGYTATWAGLVAAPAGVAAVILSPIAARIMSRIDARWMATVCFFAFGVSYLLRARFTPDSSFGVFVVPMVVQGVAMSVLFRLDADDPAGRRSTTEDPRRVRPVEFRPHHGRGFRRVADHRDLGSARGGASGAAVGFVRLQQPGDDAGPVPYAGRTGLSFAQSLGVLGRNSGQSGLYAGFARFLLDIRLALLRRSAAGLADQTRRGRPCAGGGGLSLPAGDEFSGWGWTPSRAWSETPMNGS